MTEAAPAQGPKTPLAAEPAGESTLPPELRPLGPPDKPNAFTFQYRVLKALVLRDLVSRYGEYRLGFLLSLIMPLFTVGIVMLAFGLRGRVTPPDFPLPVFLVTGYPLWMAFQLTYSRVVGAASRSDPLLMFPQITQLDLIASTIITELAINTGVYSVMMLLVSVVFRSPPSDPAGVMLLYWSCNWMGATFGLIMCGVGRLFPLAITVFAAFMRFGMWVSGVVFMVDKLPPWSWTYLQWNPILHAVEGTRQLWQSAYVSPIFNPGFILAACCVLTIAGLVIERASRRFIR